MPRHRLRKLLGRLGGGGEDSEPLANLPPSWRLVDYRGFRVCHVAGEDLIRHLKGGRYEARSVDTVAAWHGPDKVGIDVGANIGFFALGVLASAGREPSGAHPGRILAFEPNTETFLRLGLTIELNGLGEQLELYSTALADSHGVAAFARHDPRSSSGDGLVDTGRAGPATSVVVPVTTLDAFLDARGLERLDWLKLDVEGAEIRVFEGARQTLERLRPKILFEAHPVNLESSDVEPARLFDFLAAAEYRIAPLDDPARDLELDGFRSHIADRLENFLALPREHGSD